MTARRWPHHIATIAGALAALGAAATAILLGEFVSAGFFVGLAVLFLVPQRYGPRVLGPFFIAVGIARIVEEILDPISRLGIAVGAAMAGIGGWLVWHERSQPRGGWST